ncbi:MAG: helix-turn-helix transcriptional regulator [Xanthomonadales bacterium]|nr:helix-turn-helix transcriptional regulator [Xanthomonadales bacterium]
MKKSDPRWNDNRITPSSGNLFADLGFDEAEARVMAMRTELMFRLSQELKAKGWTQAQAAKRLGVTQPRISKLNQGTWQDFSLDMLLTLAGRAGLHTEIRVAR